MADVYLLSQKDRDIIAEMVAEKMRNVQGGLDLLGDPMPDLKQPEMAPEVYIAKPYLGTGIPAMDEDTREPGSAMCEIFHIQPKKDEEAKKIVSSVQIPPNYLPKQVRVYNISLERIPQQFGVIRRDKFGRWIMDATASMNQGGTVRNNSAVLELTCRAGGGENPDWTRFPFDDILAATGGSRFFLDPSGAVTLTGDAVIKMSYKIYCTNAGSGGFNTDDAFESLIFFQRGAPGDDFTGISVSYCIGILDDTDKICEDMVPQVDGLEKDQFEATAACPTFFFNAKDGDKFDVSVKRIAGSNTLNFPSITSSDLGCSFWSFEIAG